MAELLRAPGPDSDEFHLCTHNMEEGESRKLIPTHAPWHACAAPALHTNQINGI